MNSPYLSIILPTYNRLYSLKSIFLPSLEKQTYKDYELIKNMELSAGYEEKEINEMKVFIYKSDKLEPFIKNGSVKKIKNLTKSINMDKYTSKSPNLL